jgi:hypothetical protein
MAWPAMAWADVSAVDAAGFAALAASMTWPLFRARRAILLAQVVSNLLWLLHFALLDAWTAAALCGLVIVQAFSALPERPGRLSRALYAATVPAILAAAVLSWQGLPSALSAVGLLSSTAARWQKDMVPLRSWYLCAGAFWFGHNLLVGSVFGMCADLLVAFNNARRLREALRERQAAAPRPGVAAPA